MYKFNEVGSKGLVDGTLFALPFRPVPPPAKNHTLQTISLINLLPEGAPLDEAGLTSSGLAQGNVARAAKDDGLGVGEDGGDVEASGALNVHEEGVRGLHQALELVGLGLGGGGRVTKISRHN